MQRSRERRAASAAQALAGASSRLLSTGAHRHGYLAARRRVGAVTLSALLAGVGFAAVVPSAHADRPERVFERVTPAGKGGNRIISAVRATPAGDDIAFGSFAAIGDLPNAVFRSFYTARRGPTGWRTDSLVPALSEPNPNLNMGPTLQGLSDDLRTAFVANVGPLDVNDTNGRLDVAKVVAGGTSTWISPSLTLPDSSSGPASMVSNSADGRYAVLSTAKQMVAAVPAGAANELYRHGPDGLELLSALPGGAPSGGAQLGNGREGDKNALSDDGQTAFFTTTTGTPQLYMRRGPVTTLISADTHGAPGAAGSNYWAATADGSRVLFSSTSQLTAGASVGNGFYSYDVASGTLKQLFVGSVSGVLLSADGSRMYLASTATLVPGKGTVGLKLYVVDGDGLRYLSQLNNGDATLWNGGQNSIPFGMTPDGSSLVFASRAKLTATVIGTTKSAVYRFDVDGNTFTCLSCRADGSAVTASASVSDGEYVTMAGASMSRVITTDGHLAVFEAGQDLLPGDTNGLPDVYGYDDDGLFLISNGTAGKTSNVVDLSADGRDVFIRTNESLSADDTDGGYIDIYDARVGGGFPAAPEPPCSAITCGRPDETPTVFAPVGLGSLGVFDASLPADPIVKKTSFTVTAISAANRSSWARTGRYGLQVKVDAAATVTATVKASSGKQAARAQTSTKAAGNVTLPLKLSKSAAAELKRNGRLKLTVTVSASGAEKAAKATVTLTGKKPAKKVKKSAKKAAKAKSGASTKGQR